MEFNKYRKLLIEEMKKYQELLLNELEKNKNKINVDNIYIVDAVGSKTDINDRTDYMWIKVIFKKEEYWLTLFYNEIDLVTGNMHTQMGRIQFWKNIINRTPNKYIVVDNNEYWYLNYINSSEPKCGMTHVGYENYNEIVNDFIDFINEDVKIKKNIRK